MNSPTMSILTIKLAELPPACCNPNHPKRPLRHVDDQGHESQYALNPMTYSVAFILIVELLERFSFYGIYYTLTLYVTGVYDAEWNAGFTSVDAATFVAISTAVAYTTPFVGAVLADQYLGEYYTILVGAVGFYIPGLVVLAMTTVAPESDHGRWWGGDTFSTRALSIAVLFLWPMGTGINKAAVNVFGAKQFHPILQSASIESYYMGALAGITMIPTLAQRSVTAAYTIPVCMLVLGVLFFCAGTPRYVQTPPRGDLWRSAKTCTHNDDKTKKSIPLMSIFRISLLIVPFCIAYSQMPTTFAVQGTVMTKGFGVIDAASMNTLDALSVLIFGYLTGSHLYPALQRRNIKVPTTVKFALGSFFGSLSILWALFVESKIHHAYHNQQHAHVCILWQAPSYILIGCGEIFAVSAAYEVAFAASSPDTKVLASAVNIFCVGGIPNVLCVGLYRACRGWFRNSTRGDTNLQHIADYTTAHVARYFAVLVLILLVGIVVNLLPPVRDYVAYVERQALALQQQQSGIVSGGEGTPLLRKHQANSSKGMLFKMGSMRAGPSLSHKHVEPSHVPYKFVDKLYKAND